ncbi:FAD-dependent oxidoreductase [Catellatospora sp. KI3]|uniref:FAD-dependent oxidoreductase n=1 Tax=Catellatospora sp. KI3 TaxID=3041620 RepID=UPI002482488D|nr:FAD-dependent oxidoreductase [Catellatospora sp. KI3]MDI1462704.1 FAD-dependent oxidoreductase [Catellatospora sp. KI3]
MPRLHLIGSAHEYGDVHTYRFRPEGRLDFRPGEYGHLFFPQLLRRFTKPVREISFASAPGDDEVWFTLDHSSNSPFQQHFRALAPGAPMQVFGIGGHLRLPDDPARPLVLIGGGIGVTPFRSILRHLRAHQPGTPVALVHAAREHHLYAAEFAQLPIAYHQVGRAELGARLAEVALIEPPAMYLVAGSDSFVGAAVEQLRIAAVPDDAIQTDTFKGLHDLDSGAA